VTRQVAQLLGAPAISTRFSRLLIDPNRGLDDPTLIMRISDGAVVPGNRHLDAAERERRVRKYYEPYHQRIDSLIEQCVAAGVPPVLLSVHSFTDNWKGVPRPWHAAILWDRDYRFSVPLLEALRAEDGVVVGENEPYDGKLAGDCMWQHGTRRGLAHTILEVRQDLIASPEGQRAWAARIATAVQAVFARADLWEAMHQVQYFGSHTDTEGTPPFTSPAERNPA
jgi:predicted N-formylglutamate amidohydrolase